MIGRKGLCLQADAPLVAIFRNMFVVKPLNRFNTEHLLPTTNKYMLNIAVTLCY